MCNIRMLNTESYQVVITYMLFAQNTTNPVNWILRGMTP
jgi:hypothetical protein